MSREVEFILSKSGDIIAARAGSVAYIGDDRDWWLEIWERRDDFGGTAHSHPHGMARPSWEDITTWQAYEVGLNESYPWYVVTETTVVEVSLVGNHAGDPDVNMKTMVEEPWWVPLLRELSYGGMEK